jgi:hypothetical protein
MPTNNLKHVGQLINTQRRCVVVFREVPGEPNNCLIVDTDALPDWIHDDVMNAVESTAGQEAANFYDYAARAVLTDGSSMLTSLHNKGLLTKASTDNVMMTPNRETTILLADLNKIINEQFGENAFGEKASVTETNNTASESDVINDADIAKNMLAQADQFEAEAARLREEAYDMDPSLKPKKRSRKTKTEAVE